MWSVKRILLLLIGTLALAVAFIAAYAGGLHDPRPRDLPVGVVRDDAAADRLLTQVRERTTNLKAVEYDDARAAGDALRRRKIYAILATSQAPGLSLTTASGAGPAATEVIEETLNLAASATGTSLAVADVVPVSEEDPRGLVPFYLVVGLVFGGYLASTALGIGIGTVPPDLDDAAGRVGLLALFSALLGAAGAVIVGPILDVWTDHLLGIGIAGALITFATALVTSAVQGWLGLLGTGLVLLVFVVLGNPGSGGIYAPEFLPGFFAGIHRWDIPGLGVSLIKGVGYFDREATGWPVTALVLWALVGLGGFLAAARLRRRPILPK